MRVLMVLLVALDIALRLVGGLIRALLGMHGNAMQLLVAVVLGVAFIGALVGPHAGDDRTASAGGESIGSIEAITPSGTVTPASWADALLRSLGDQPTAENLKAITAWERAEGGHWQNRATYNPLNTTQVQAGSHAMNSVGVQAYASWSEGMAATVITLRNGRYGDILAALQGGNCAPCVASAVAASPWGTGRFPT